MSAVVIASVSAEVIASVSAVVMASVSAVAMAVLAALAVAAVALTARSAGQRRHMCRPPPRVSGARFAIGNSARSAKACR